MIDRLTARIHHIILSIRDRLEAEYRHNNRAELNKEQTDKVEVVWQRRVQTHGAIDLS